MADPLDYTLVRMDDNISDKAIVAYDAVNDKLVDSGLKGHQGELSADAGTVGVGLQEMSSAGEQVVWRNTDSKTVYSPPWHIIDEINPGGSFDRYYGDVQTETRYATRTDVVENPVFDVYVPNHEVVFKLNMTFPVAHKDVQFMITHAGYEVWREVIDVSSGTQDITLDIPISFYPGTYEFSIRQYSPDGVGLDMLPPVKVMGDGLTGTVGYDVVYRPFREVKLATEEYVNAFASGANPDDVMLKSVYDVDDDGKVDAALVAEKLQGIALATNDTYYGKNASGEIGFWKLPEGADEDALKASIKQVSDLANANKATIDSHETAIEGHGKQLATNTQAISTNTNNIKLNHQIASEALKEASQVRNLMVDGITADVDHAAKTITVKLTSKSGHVDSVLINLSSWFSGGSTPQPGVTHKLYFGYTSSTQMTEGEVVSTGSTKTVDALTGTELTLERQTATPAYMYVWIPDTAGTIKGFTFSGFVSAWQSTALNVAGIDGKLFISPNKTSALSVTFEVTV